MEFWGVSGGCCGQSNSGAQSRLRRNMGAIQKDLRIRARATKATWKPVGRVERKIKYRKEPTFYCEGISIALAVRSLDPTV